jgi:hypothetical protein
MNDDNKRKGIKPIPPNYRSYMNEAQQAQLVTIEGFGWNLKFIRRPVHGEKVVVVVSPDGGSIGVLEEDGRLNLDPKIVIRD